jgi:pimeloyl-ACP methyl ester carboxylesterase
MSLQIRLTFLTATTLYQIAKCWQEDRKPPMGELIDVGGYHLHLFSQGKFTPTSPTIILDHSLGGIEGYLLIDKLSELGRVCIYDRAGYGWSDRSPHSRSSSEIVKELDILLTKANITPPYILIGDSFGSYNVRLYAHQFPEKVVGMILTDGLHEQGMLKMPRQLVTLKFFFLSGFIMSVLGSSFGIIRLMAAFGAFELLKPELKNFPKPDLDAIKRSFFRPQHWITMSQEILSLNSSANQVSIANDFGAMPIVNIKSSSFFKPSFLTRFIPLAKINQLRAEMHLELMKLSTDCTQLQAESSDHFVWIDRPDLIIAATKLVLDKVSRNNLIDF